MHSVAERVITPTDDSTVEHVLEAVKAWKDGCPVLDLLRAIRGHEVYLTIRAVSPKHAQWRDLMGMIEDMATHTPTSRNGMWFRDTIGQWWSTDDLRDLQARIDLMPDGYTRILFPIAYPGGIPRYAFTPEERRGRA